MVWRIGQFYARRIVNVNVNVIVAGALAGLIGVLCVSLTRYFSFFEAHRGWIVAIGAVSDIIADVTIYYVLHWVANHWSMLKWARLHVPQVMGEQSFLRSATLVQFERAMLSPIYYGAFVTTNYILIHPPLNVPREAAFAAGLLAGLSTTRVLHTLWMLRGDRKSRRPPPSAPGGDTCPTDGPRTTGPAASSGQAGERNGVHPEAQAGAAGMAHRVER